MSIPANGEAKMRRIISLAMVAALCCSCMTTRSVEQMPIPSLDYAPKNPTGHVPLRAGMEDITGCPYEVHCKILTDKVYSDFRNSSLFDSFTRDFNTNDVDIVLSFKVIDYSQDLSGDAVETVAIIAPLVPVMALPLVLKSTTVGLEKECRSSGLVALSILSPQTGKEIAQYKAPVLIHAKVKVRGIDYEMEELNRQIYHQLQQQLCSATEMLMQQIVDNAGSLVTMVNRTKQ